MSLCLYRPTLIIVFLGSLGSPRAVFSVRSRRRCTTQADSEKMQMSHNLNSLKGGYIGDDTGDYYRGY